MYIISLVDTHDTHVHISTNKKLHCLTKELLYRILDNWCMRVIVSCGHLCVSTCPRLHLSVSPCLCISIMSPCL